MRFLLVSHIFPPAIDGGSKVVHKIGQYLESKGHQVLYLSSNCFSTDDFVNPRSTNTISQSDPTHIYLPVYKWLKKPLKLLSFLPLFQLLRKGPIFRTIPLIKGIIQIRQFQPQYIICGPLPTTIVYFCHLLNKYFLDYSKIIINASFHQNDSDFYNPLLIKSLKHAQLIWSLTQNETNFYINNLKINSSKIITLGNGVDTDFLIKNTSHYQSKNILFIGSFSQHKNISTLIKSFNKVHQQIPDSTLTLAGQNTLYSHKIKAITKHKNIKLHINPSDQEILQLIDNCQILVQPSLQESFGLTLIEAAARKKPIITSNISTLSEINAKLQSGLIFDSPQQLVKHLLYLLDHPQICQNLGNQGYLQVKKTFTWDKIGQLLESAILKL